MDTSTYAIEAEVEATHWWFEGRRRLLGNVIRGLGVSPNARVLDIGTSTGTNLRMLRDLGFTHVEGLDSSSEAIRWCREKGLGNVSQGDVCAMPFEDETFDLVLATDIIEHVEDDLLALTEIRRVLRTGAPAVITVPAFEWLWGLQDEVAHHKRRYRGSVVRNRIEQARLRCLESFYFNYLLLLPIFAARQIIRILRVNLQSENSLNSRYINAILTRVFALDVLCAPYLRAPFGVSFLAVTRKLEPEHE